MLLNQHYKEYFTYTLSTNNKLILALLIYNHLEFLIWCFAGN